MRRKRILRDDECIEILLDRSIPIEKKAATLAVYTYQYEAQARSLGVHKLFGRVVVAAALLEGVSGEDAGTKARLMDTLAAIAGFNEETRQKLEVKIKANAEELCALDPGTPIVIQHRRKERVIRFIEMKRTRFIGEYPDGRRRAVSAELFLRVRR